MINVEFSEYLKSRGAIFHDNRCILLTDEAKRRLVMDAQPQLGSAPNSAILSYFTTYIDPMVLEYLFSPLKAIDVAGEEVKKGTWLDTTVVFNTVEFTGEVSSYGDYSENGNAKFNQNFPQRQPYTYQVITKWGVQEMERIGLTRIDGITQQNKASIWTLNNYQNQTYFFGVDGLQNYGLLNDPSLPPPISPLVVGGFTLWSDKDALAIYNDIVALYNQLSNVQADGNVELDTPMTLAVSPYSQAQMTKVTQFNVNVSDMIKKNFPNLKIVTAPQLNTPSGQLVRLKADRIQDLPTEQVSFTEKLRAFPVITKESSFTQKKSQGTNGALIYRPIFVASMLGV